MIVKTFDEITEHMEDSFDGFIADKTDGVKIKRTNNNVVHNVLKADGKGYELIQASCVALDSKFDPARCSEADLVSVAKIAGTEMKQGKQTVLMITARNTSSQAQDILSSVASYPAKLRFMYSADVWFEFTIPSTTIFGAEGSQTDRKTYFAWSVSPDSTEEDGSQSPLIGAYPVTAMEDISISAVSDGTTISQGFTFDCASTEGTLGYDPETPLEFRKRILEDTDRQSILKELELELNNLPTILSATVTFNPSISNPVPVSTGITIPPYQMLISVNGEVTQDFGETVLSKTYIPTVAVGSAYNGDFIKVPSENSTDGYIQVNYMRYIPYEYMIEVTYSSDPTLALDDMIQSQVSAALKNLYGNPSRYTKELTEDTYYDVVKGLDIDSLKVLNVNLLEYDSGWDEPDGGYMPIPASELARMCGVTFIYGDNQEKDVFFYQAAAPVFELEGTSLTISSSAPDAVLYYTTDGTDPTTASSVYSTALTVSDGEVVKVLVTSPYRSPSDIAEYEVEI